MGCKQCGCVSGQQGQGGEHNVWDVNNVGVLVASSAREVNTMCWM